MLVIFAFMNSPLKNFSSPKSPLDMMISVTKTPVAIGLDANNFYFRFYKSGVIDVPKNVSKELNHAVLLVGYDYDDNGMFKLKPKRCVKSAFIKK